MTTDSCRQTLLEVAYIAGWMEGACIIVSICAMIALAVYVGRRQLGLHGHHHAQLAGGLHCFPNV